MAPLCVRRRRHKKTPPPLLGAGFFGNLQVVILATWITPSARTSVGNKEYEYKDKKERAAQLQQAVDRQKTVRFGGAAGVAALRHVTERKRCVCGLSTVCFETLLRHRGFSFGRLAIQMILSMESGNRTHAHAARAESAIFQRRPSERR